MAAASATAAHPEHHPLGFKGIALFTPGGDVVYCRDEQKRSQWHVNLCATLQEYLTLSAPPHFLVPVCSATVDRWFDADRAVWQTVAEANPAVLRYQALLNQLFGLGNLEWQPLYPKPEVSSAAVMATYREQFPELWHNHDLLVEVTHRQKLPQDEAEAIAPGTVRTGPTLRLFVSGHSSFTEQILKTLQQVLDNSRHRPYSLKVVDVSKHPEQAEADQITATPTLVRVWPTPVRRLVGELDDPQAILWLLADA